MTATHVHGPACAAEPHPAATASSPGGLALRSGAAGLLAFLAALSTWVLVRNPLQNTVFPPCPLHVTTGLWCPGCGATRASYLLLHGDVAGALHFNALWVALAPLALYQSLAFSGRAFGVRWLRPVPFSVPLIIALLGAILGFGIVRNLPFDFFEMLNPVATS